MKYNYLFLILILFISISGMSQSNFVSVIVELKAGAKIPGSINKNTDFVGVERIGLIDLENVQKNIPLKVIKEIKTNDGEILFPVKSKTTIKSRYSTIILKAGSEQKGNLKLGGQDPSILEKITFIDKENNERNIPLKAISKIVDVYGKTIYSNQKLNFPEEVVEKVVKNTCGLEGEKLKAELITAFQSRYVEIDQLIMNKTKEYNSASFDMEEKLKKELYSLIEEDVKELAEVNTMVKAVLRIYVDDKGKFVKVQDEVLKSNQLRYYTVLRDKNIYPKLKFINYEVNETKIEFKNEYDKIYNSFQPRLSASSCPISEFDEILSDAKRKLDEKEKNIKTTFTVYSIPIEFNFSNKIQKWTYYNETLKVKVKNDFVKITRPEVKEQFNSKFTKKQKNGKYIVNATYYSSLSDETKIKIKSVKRKYKYMTHFGVSTFAHLPLIRPFNTPSVFNNSLGDIYTFNINIIFHRIGFFGGTMYNSERFTNKFTGTYINQKFPTYGEGGLYLGLAQWFYLKGGYSYLKTEIVEYDNGLLLYSEKERESHGFIAGLAFMFPYVNIEWGYNSNLGSFYAGAGLHVTLNK